MGVTLVRRSLFAGHEHHFGVGFKPHHTIEHLNPNGLHLVGPIDVGFFIKTGFELQHHRHLFATRDCLPQQIHQFRAGSGSVNGLLDDHHIGVIDSLAEKLQHHLKALVRLVQEHIALFKLLKNTVFVLQLFRNGCRKRLKTQLGLIDQIHQLSHANQVHRAGHAVQSAFGQIKLLEQKLT